MAAPAPTPSPLPPAPAPGVDRGNALLLPAGVWRVRVHAPTCTCARRRLGYNGLGDAAEQALKAATRSGLELKL